MKCKCTAFSWCAFELHISMMQFRNLLYHGKTQTRTTFASTGSIHLVKTLPDFFLLLFGDANTIIFHMEQNLIAFSFQLYPNLTISLTIFNGIFYQVLNQTSHQRHIQLQYNGIIQCKMESCEIISIFFASLMNQISKIHWSKLHRFCPLIQSGNTEKLRNQIRHFHCLPIDHINGFRTFFRRFFILFRILTGTFDNRSRRSQLMGSIGSKLLFRFERFFQPCKHFIKSRCQSGKFIIALRYFHSCRQVRCFTNGISCLYHLLQRSESTLCNQITANGCQQNKDRHGCGGTHNQISNHHRIF